jgi:hypothetical protein
MQVKNGEVYDGACEVKTFLENAKATTTSDMLKLTHPFPNHCWEKRVGGTVSALTVLMEGSLDGIHWYTIDTTNSTADEMRWVTGKNAKYIRFRITAFTGSGSPAASVTILWLPAIK